MRHPDEHLIRDEDLRAKLEEARGKFLFEQQVGILVTTQRRRDDERQAEEAKAQALAVMPRERRRRAIIREVIENTQPTPADLRHIHSVIAVCGMPYDRPPPEVRRFEKQQGNMSLLIQAGELTGKDQQWVQQPLPFGPKARLIMIYLCSEAIRQKNPTIEIADSLSGFIRDMGFPVTGGKKGTLQAFKEQLNALAACDMKIGVWDGAGQTARTRRITPFDSIDVWLPPNINPDQKMFWPDTVTFNDAFYKSLDRHALPVSAHVIRTFAGSARKLDLYTWMGYRLHNIDTTLRVSWKALAEQFGGSFARPRAFRAQFAQDLAHLKEVLPKIPVKVTEDGLVMEPADPHVLALPAPRAARKS
ncbi:hypothetical protein EZH22_31275 (plasmid) [Xanthobacter dioxanivorans]|uniref:Pirin n=1 Tax=Xanthobacter dioxanivorans TaxID=2528964 RepID=A0A974SMB2_9HYPH|nr:replication protein RepA [Xanthobacter dioxanivorans]QRG10284.1 hypothetical protein EZH22_31275 [Xanthobacter dioxanivorans]